MMRELKGIHVLAGFGLAFGVIIAVNLTLAVRAVATFPGLETANTYVASQRFDAERAAQSALGWSVDAGVEDGTLRLAFHDAQGPVEPVIVSAVLGRATHTGADQHPEFSFDGRTFTASVALAPGNWNLRLEARAQDGTLYRRRIALRVSR